MKTSVIGKVISVVVLGMLLAFSMHLYHASRMRMGREKFLTKQAERYDKHYVKPKSYMVEFIAGMILLIPCFGLYEGIAWGASKAFASLERGDNE